MRRTVSGRQAAIHLAGVRLKGNRLEGSFLANDINDRMQRFNINVTYVETPKLGSCHGGKYSGAYDIIARNSSDWFETDLEEADCDNLPGTFGPIHSLQENTAVSFRRADITVEPVSQLWAMMHTTSTGVYAFLLSAVLIIWFFLWITESMNQHVNRSPKKNQRKRHDPIRKDSKGLTFQLFAIFLRQTQAMKQRLWSRKQFFFSFTLLAFFVSQFVMYMYESGLLVQQKLEAIDSLEDLANSKNYTACFLAPYNLWKTKFAEAKHHPYSTIWRKAMEKNRNDTSKFLKPAKGRWKPGFEDQVLITMYGMNRYVRDMFCKFMKDLPGMENRVTHESRERFLPARILSIMRFGIPKPLKERLHDFYISNLEFGLNDYFLKGNSGSMKSPEIRRCLTRSREELDSFRQTAVDVGETSYWSFLKVYFYMMLVSSAALMKEWVQQLVRIMSRRNKN